MAQGLSKGLKAKTGSGGRKKTGYTKPGKRVVAPKDAGKVREKMQNKQLSSKINNNIEKQMVSAASAGKLSIMRSVGELEAGAGKDQGKNKGAKGKGKGKA